MTRPQEKDYGLVFFGLLALWIGIELVYSSGWLSIRAILQAPIRTGPQANSIASLFQRPGQAAPPRVWFAPYTSFPEPYQIESPWRSGVYDTFLAFPPSGVASNYGAMKLGPADLLFTQASSQGLAQEARLAMDLGYQLFALDLGAINQGARIAALCKTVPTCHVSSDGYALLPLDRAHRAWIGRLGAVDRLYPDFPQRAAGFRWAGVVLQPDQWFVPAGSDLLIEPGPRPIVRVWARASRRNALYAYRDGDLSVPVASRLHTRQRRIWLALVPALAAADLCLQRPGQAPCTPIRLARNQPRAEISGLVPLGQVTTIITRALYGPRGEAIQLNQSPLAPGSSQDQAVFGIEIR
jgi:hypothetical protein